MWISLIVTLISYFLSKKSGNSNAKSALIAAAAGAGTYYAATETDWGKSTLGELNNSIADVAGFGAIDTKTGEKVAEANTRVLRDGQGNPVMGPDGQPLYERVSSPVSRDTSGNPIQASDGSIANSLIKGTAGVLSSWGGTGTAAVIGTTAVATSSNIDWKKVLPWAIGGGILLMLAK